MSEQEDKFTANKAIEFGIITVEQLKDALEYKALLQDLGMEKDLKEILINKGYITNEIWERLKKAKTKEEYEASLPKIEESIPTIDSLFQTSDENKWKVEEEILEITKDIPSNSLILDDTISTTEENESVSQKDNNEKLNILDFTTDKVQLNTTTLSNKDSLLIVDEQSSESKDTVEIKNDENIVNFSNVKLKEDLEPREESFPKIKGYEIIKLLGKGAMGKVYKGIQISVKREVAIKVLDPLLSKDETIVERFKREYKTMALLDHPNIVSSIDGGINEEGLHYFIMEFIKGETVESILKREGKIPVKRALKIILDIAKALDYLHSKNIIHRDIKPDNIMITEEGNAKLCDLGLGRDISTKSSLTLVGTTLGTPHYISPEQAKGEKKIDGRADIYSLGATLYHLITGSVPFPNKDPVVVCTCHATKPFPDPREIDPSIPVEVCNIIKKCTFKDRKKRYQKAKYLIKDIENCLEKLKDVEIEEKKEKKEDKEIFTLAGIEKNIDFVEETKPIDYPITEKEKIVTERRIRKKETHKTSVRYKIKTPEEIRKERRIAILVGILSLIIILSSIGYIIYPFLIEYSKHKPKINKKDIAFLKKKERESSEEYYLKQRLNLIIPLKLDINEKSIENIKIIFKEIEKIKKKYEKKKKLLNLILKKEEKFLEILVKSIKIWKKEEKENKKNYENKSSFIINEIEFKENIENFINLTFLYEKIKYLEKKVKKYQNLLKNIKRKKEILKKRLKNIENVINEKYTTIVLNIEETFKKREDFFEDIIKKYKGIKEILEKYIHTPNISNKIKEYINKYIKDINKRMEITKINYENISKHNIKKYWKYIKREIEDMVFKGKIIDLENINKYEKYYGIKKYVAFIKKTNKFMDIKEINTIENLPGLNNKEKDWIKFIHYLKNRNFKEANEIFHKNKDDKFYKKIYLIFSNYLEREIIKNEIKTKFNFINHDFLDFENTQTQQKRKKILEIFKKMVFLKRKFKKKIKEFLTPKDFNLLKRIEKEFLKYYDIDLYIYKHIKYNKYPSFIKIEYSLKNSLSLKEGFKIFNKHCKYKIIRKGLEIIRDNNKNVPIFEMLFKIKFKTQSSISVKVIPKSKKRYNIGVFIFKIDDSFFKLRKYLGLIYYNLGYLKKAELNKLKEEDRIYKVKIEKDNTKSVLLFLKKQLSVFIRYYSNKDIVEEQKDFKYKNKKFYLILKGNEKKINFIVKPNLIKLKNQQSIRVSEGYVGIYTNCDTIFSDLTIEGIIDSEWRKQIQIKIKNNKKFYINRAIKMFINNN